MTNSRECLPMFIKLNIQETRYILVLLLLERQFLCFDGECRGQLAKLNLKPDVN